MYVLIGKLCVHIRQYIMTLPFPLVVKGSCHGLNETSNCGFRCNFLLLLVLLLIV